MKIRFHTLQDSLRAGIWARLERGELTGKGLAHKAGFQQAHLSNFLNGKRGLSLHAMDRLLDVLHLDALDLAGVDPILRHIDNAEGRRDNAETVVVVSLDSAAHLPRFTTDHIQDTVSFERSFLRRLKPKTIGNRRDWARFVAVKLRKEDVDGIPLLKAGAVILIDRHSNALPPANRPQDQGLYAVLDGAKCLIRRITVAPGTLILREHTEKPASTLRLVPIPPGRRASDLVIGKIRHLSTEI